MFESLSQIELQQYWWLIVSLTGGILMFLMFVLGGQTLIFAAGRTETERNLIINSLRRKWIFTTTALVAFFGILFAAFPLFCSINFSGAYWLWVIIIISFILQSVSYEFRANTKKHFSHRLCEYFMLFNGFAGTILTGILLGAFFNGVMFSIDDMNMARWETPYHGLETALNPYNLLLGISVFFLVRVLALLYFLNNINHKHIAVRSKIRLFRNFTSFLAFFAAFLVYLMINDGFNYDPETKIVNMETNKYLNNLLEMPVILAMMILGILLILFGVIRSLVRGHFNRGIWYAGTGTILTVMSLLLLSGLNHTCFFPSTKAGYLQDSLTIENSSASNYTLTVMSKLSLFIPLVAVCIFWAWKTINRNRISTEELNEEIKI